MAEFEIIATGDDEATVVVTPTSDATVVSEGAGDIAVVVIEVAERGPQGDPGPPGPAGAAAMPQVVYSTTRPDFAGAAGLWGQNLGGGNITLWFEDGE